MDPTHAREVDPALEEGDVEEGSPPLRPAGSDGFLRDPEPDAPRLGLAWLHELREELLADREARGRGGARERTARLFQRIAFDRALMGATAQTTDADLDLTLGSASEIVLHAVVDQVTGDDPTLTVNVEHSEDGRWWAAKGATPVIEEVALAAGSRTVAIGFDDGAIPSLSRVRLRIELGGTGFLSAHVVVNVCGRSL
jgi:hypothetical protein